MHAVISERPQTEQVLAFADDEVRFSGCGAFEDALVVGIFLNDVFGGLHSHSTSEDG